MRRKGIVHHMRDEQMMNNQWDSSLVSRQLKEQQVDKSAKRSQHLSVNRNKYSRVLSCPAYHETVVKKAGVIEELKSQ